MILYILLVSAEYSFDSCINRRDESKTEEELLCDDISSKNLWRLHQLNRHRCVIRKVDLFNKYAPKNESCFTMKLRKKVHDRFQNEICGSDNCKGWWSVY